MSESTSVDQNALRRRGIGLRAIDRSAASPGYTLFAPLTGRGAVYAIDLEGEVVHEWKLPYAPGQTAYLLPNGNLFYNGKLPDPATRLFPIWSAYGGGVVLEADPTGKIVWEWCRPDHHHDASQLRNGNAIVLGLEKLPPEFSATLRGGQPNSEFEGASYGDVIYEVDRKGEIVWEYSETPPQYFFSPYMSSAQRLPNGNTLITEASFGRIFEVTPQRRVVWEYVVPYFAPYEHAGKGVSVGTGEQNAVHRAFRYTAEQIPWLAC
jgi:hypothetical protein